MNDFNSQAEVWRYLLEDEGNMVVCATEDSCLIYKIIDGTLMVADKGEPIGSHVNFFSHEDFKIHKVKTWQESINDKPIWCFVKDDGLDSWRKELYLIHSYLPELKRSFESDRTFWRYAKPATEKEVLAYVYKCEL